MTFNDLLNSPVFFDTLLKNDAFFNSLKDKFPEILADLTSARDNPNCTCKNKVQSYLRSSYKKDKEFFDNFINISEIKDLLEKNKEKLSTTSYGKLPTVAFPPGVPMPFTEKQHYNPSLPRTIGRVFEIGKTEEDWKNFVEKLYEEKILLRSFSIVEKEDKLIVYLI